MSKAVALESWDEVEVGMINDLSGVFAIVHHKIDAVTIERFFECERHDAPRFGYCRPVWGRNVEDISRMILGNHERVARGHGMNIEEGHSSFVIVDFQARYFPTDDFTKET